MHNMVLDGLERISARKAFELFKQDKPFMICSHKMHPTGNLGGCMIGPDSIKEWKRHAAFYAPDGITPNSNLWVNNLDRTAWGLFYNNWKYYNTSYEQGYYASFWIDTKALIPDASSVV